MINYNKALYRKDNKGNPCIWFGTANELDSTITIQYGILGKTITKEVIKCARNAASELNSKINTKRKNGYVTLSDVSDSAILPVEESSIIAYLTTYLPSDRQSSTGAMLPMLAKLYDNTNNKMFTKVKHYIAQPKINGLRCEIGAKSNDSDLFKPVKLTFQSREGTYWDSLSNLEDYLLKAIPTELLRLMVEENYLLDGELYLPGKTVNDMNSLVKNTKNEDNKYVQFWCYDIAIPEMSQHKRLDILKYHLRDYYYNVAGLIKNSDYKELQGTVFPKRLIYLGYQPCLHALDAVYLRDKYIKWDFEGLILRDPDAEYQFGKRNSAMWKFKAVTDGKFNIVDIKSEGDKRSHIPLLVLKNDINDSLFNVHITGSFEYQSNILLNKEDYINKRRVFVEYGERSGVNQLPFHVKTVTLIEE